MSVLPGSLFRAYDIRGVVDDSLTEEAMYLIARAYASQPALKPGQKVIVGRDGRSSSQRFAEALIRGLLDSGMQVLDIGPAPTPVAYFAARRSAGGACLMVTGSHTPPDTHGVKMMIDNAPLHDEQVQDLQRRIEAGDVRRGQGTRTPKDFKPAYIQRLRRDIRLARPLRIGIDCANAAAGVIAPDLFEALGCEVHALNTQVDGRFPDHPPNPSKPENLRALIEAVRRERLDLGLAFDGDGERLGLIDDAGRIIWPDRLLMLHAVDMLKRHPGATVVYDIQCSRYLEDLIKDAGGHPLMYKSGHGALKAKLEEVDGLLGGGLSGHVLFRDRWYGFHDALYAGARVLELIARDTRKAGEVFAGLPDNPCTPVLNIPFASEPSQSAFMHHLLREASFPGARITRIDGLRVDYSDGWGLVQAAKSGPGIDLRFEGESTDALRRIQHAFRELLQSIDPALQPPF